MQMCREYVQGVIALDKSLHILIEYPLGKLAVLAYGTHIRKVSHLDDYLVEKLFLLGETYLFVIIGDTSVCAFLLGIVLFKCFVKELVIGLFQRYVAIGHVQMRSVSVHVFRDKATIIVGKASFPESYTYCSVYTFTSVLSARRVYFFASETSDSVGFVTFVKSNAKALLTLRIKSPLRSAEGIG